MEAIHFVQAGDIQDQTVPQIQGIDLHHICRREGEVMDIEILLNALGMDGFRNGYDVLLLQPPQYDLGR